MEQEINQQQFSQSEQKSGGKMKNLIFVGVISSIFGALIVGGIVYFTLNNSYSEKQIQLNNQISMLQNQVEVLKKQNEVSQQSPTPTQIQPNASDNATGLKTYENKEIGLSFRYPANYGDFQISINNGETGKKFTGGFQDNRHFSIGGITADFTAGRSGYFLDFVKYLYEGGKYYHLMALDKRWLVEPIKTITVADQKVLIVNGDGYVEERNVEGPTINPGPNGGALINIPGTGEFKGVAVWNSDIKALPQSDFEEIIKTFKFTK
jgi:hypothetical protein